MGVARPVFGTRPAGVASGPSFRFETLEASVVAAEALRRLPDSVQTLTDLVHDATPVPLLGALEALFHLSHPGLLRLFEALLELVTVLADEVTEQRFVVQLGSWAAATRACSRWASSSCRSTSASKR